MLNKLHLVEIEPNSFVFEKHLSLYVNLVACIYNLCVIVSKHSVCAFFFVQCSARFVHALICSDMNVLSSWTEILV